MKLYLGVTRKYRQKGNRKHAEGDHDLND